MLIIDAIFSHDDHKHTTKVKKEDENSDGSDGYTKQEDEKTAKLMDKINKGGDKELAKAVEKLAFSMDQSQEKKIDDICCIIEKYRCQQKETKQAENTPFVTTFGLCCHSLADGAAMGTSLFFSSVAATEDSASNVGVVIFFAILMHKIPASIGLGTFL